MPTLFLVRHGEPRLRGAFLGQNDCPLSETGRAQMAALNLTAEVFYASPLRRSYESAQIAARGRRVEVLEDLAEIAMGEWEGLSWTQIEERYPEVASEKIRNWTEVTPPAGEPWSSFTQRVDRAISVVRRGPFPAAVVGHLAVNSCITYRLSDLPPELFQQDYGQCIEYEI